jgi:hypothetical protein
VPSHRGMLCRQVVGAGYLYIWRVAGNILNQRLPTAKNGWPPWAALGRS